MLQKRLQTPHEGAQNGPQGNPGNAGVKEKAGESGILYLFSSRQTDGCFSPVCL